MFWQRAIVSDDMSDWIVENFDWLEEKHPDLWGKAQLILPTKSFFAAKTGRNLQTATEISKQVAEHLGVTDDFRLEELPELPEEFRFEYGKLSETAGEYHHDADVPLIRYRPSLMQQPMAFINTMAHELMHLRLADHIDQLPGGEEAHELATDLHCIIAGFGIFQLQSSEDQGWSGYMSQASRAKALAVFLKRKDVDPQQALTHLSARPSRWLKKAYKQT